jgi:hypothetical protein
MSNNPIHIERRIEAIEKVVSVSEDPIKAFQEGKYPELGSLMDIAVMYHRGRRRGEPPTSFFHEYPPALRDYLQKLNEEAFLNAQQHCRRDRDAPGIQEGEA